jgi:predicted ABC-type ATPase
MIEEQPQLIVIAGVPGSGRSTFSKCYKNAFIHSLPIKAFKEGLSSGDSFATILTLAAPEDMVNLQKAHRHGYRITIYYMFTGKLLSMLRARYRQVAEGVPFNESAFKKNYAASYKGLISTYQRCDIVFFIRNQKEFEFLAAYDPKKTTLEVFSKALKVVKTSVDAIK